MKIFITYILLTLAISISMGTLTAHAQGNTNPDEIDKLVEEIASPNQETTTPQGDTKPKDFVLSEIPKPTLLPGTKTTDRGTLVRTILPRLAVGIIGFVGVASLIFLLIGGIRFATAYGNDESIDKGKQQIIYALVGFLLALLSYTIVVIINNLFIEEQTEEAVVTEESADTETEAEAAYFPIIKI